MVQYILSYLPKLSQIVGKLSGHNRGTREQGVQRCSDECSIGRGTAPRMAGTHTLLDSADVRVGTSFSAGRKRDDAWTAVTGTGAC